MHPAPLPFLDVAALADLAETAGQAAPCTSCASLACPGWESVPGSFDRRRLRSVATLRRSDDDAPTLEEYHPAGTDLWSPQAPIAPAFFPYNRCEVWTCNGCGRPFLHYTEYGGYYQEERLRELRRDLVSDAVPNS